MPNNSSTADPHDFTGHDPALPPTGKALAGDYYQRLLGLRVIAGRKLIDELSHGITKVTALYGECERLDEMLEQFPRYRRDYTGRVVTAEARRLHVPGRNRPADDHEVPCLLCRKAAVALQLSMVLPAQDAA